MQKKRPSLFPHNYNVAPKDHVTHLVLVSRVRIDARLPELVPVLWQVLVARILPIVEHLVDDLGNVLRTRIRSARVVRCRRLVLRQSDARPRVGEEDLGKRVRPPANEADDGKEEHQPEDHRNPY
jgi:hypothetical protein